MATNRYLAWLNNMYQMVVPAVLGGAGSAGQIPALNANGQLDVSMMPNGIGHATVVLTTAVAISAGNLVNIESGTVKLADCSTGLKANGWVDAAFASGVSATVYRGSGVITTTGLTVGEAWLGQAGAVLAAPPTTAGYLAQNVGVATSATALQFTAQDIPVVVA